MNAITLDDVEAQIVDEHYFTAAQGAAFAAVGKHDRPIPGALCEVTLCALLLRNGTKIVGVNYGPVDPVAFNPMVGRDAARADAVRQIWPLMGYALREQLSAREQQGAAP